VRGKEEKYKRGEVFLWEKERCRAEENELRGRDQPDAGEGKKNAFCTELLPDRGEGEGRSRGHQRREGNHSKSVMFLKRARGRVGRKGGKAMKALSCQKNRDEVS